MRKWWKEKDYPWKKKLDREKGYKEASTTFLPSGSTRHKTKRVATFTGKINNRKDIFVDLIKTEVIYNKRYGPLRGPTSRAQYAFFAHFRPFFGV